ncbi:hypothetical protein [uncultured Sphingomonas sp.]|uniref:hypothetical protein n=1 Tax=uncultured Sphingomonas sp. TaxID=158754 RepID=UPI0035C99E44
MTSPRRRVAKTAIAADPDPSPGREIAPADFTPAPRRERQDGWTAHRQRIFIQALAETGSVTAAAAEAGITPRSAYRLRTHPDACAFAAAWDRALGVATGQLVALAFDRAVNGALRQKWRNGELVSETRAPSDRMLTFLLKQFDRKRFGPYRWIDAFANRTAELALRNLPGELDALADFDAFPPTTIDGWPDLRHAPDAGI